MTIDSGSAEIGVEVDEDEVKYIAPLSRRERIGCWVAGVGLADFFGSVVYTMAREQGFRIGNNLETWLGAGGVVVGAAGAAFAVISGRGRDGQPSEMQPELPGTQVTDPI